MNMKKWAAVCWIVLWGIEGAMGSDVAPKSVDGTLISKGDKDYRIVSTPKNRELNVYVTGNTKDLPSVLVLQVKRKSKLLEKVQLKLDQRDPEHSRYIGIVPASVSISGGITFDLE